MVMMMKMMMMTMMMTMLTILLLMMMMMDPFIFGFLDSWITPSPDNLLPVDIHLALVACLWSCR
jgi:hypothetical protein